MNNRGIIENGCGILTIFLIISCIPAWITHVITTIQNEQWVLLVVGAIVAPVGIVHGWGIWLGIF